MTDKFFADDGTPNLERLGAMRAGDLLNEYEDRRDALLAAKEDTDDSPAARKRRDSAATALDRFRSFWRAVDTMQPGSTRPVAPITSKSKG